MKVLICLGLAIGAAWFTHTREYGFAVYWGLVCIILATYRRDER
jgi:hypothetical protein